MKYLILAILFVITTGTAYAEYVPETYKKKEVKASPYIASEKAMTFVLRNRLNIGDSFYCPAGLGNITFTRLDTDLYIWKWMPDFSNSAEMEYHASALCQPTQQGTVVQAAASWRWFMEHNNTPH